MGEERCSLRKEGCSLGRTNAQWQGGVLAGEEYSLGRRGVTIVLPGGRDAPRGGGVHPGDGGCSLGRRDVLSGKKGAPWGGGVLPGEEECSVGRGCAPSCKKGAPWGGGMLNGRGEMLPPARRVLPGEEECSMARRGARWGGVLPGEEGCSPQCSLGRRGPPWGKAEASLLGVGEGQLLSSPGLTDPRAVLWPLPWSPS